MPRLMFFPWDIWVALAIFVLAVLIAIYLDWAPVLVFVLTLFVLCAYVVIQNRFSGRSS